MKKVGLITYHKSYNYGAMLQVYATQYIIKKMGYDCKIIDYVNKDEEKENKLFFYKKNFTFMHNVKDLLRNIFLKLAIGIILGFILLEIIILKILLIN